MLRKQVIVFNLVRTWLCLYVSGSFSRVLLPVSHTKDPPNSPLFLCLKTTTCCLKNDWNRNYPALSGGCFLRSTQLETANSLFFCAFLFSDLLAVTTNTDSHHASGFPVVSTQWRNCPALLIERAYLYCASVGTRSFLNQKYLIKPVMDTWRQMVFLSTVWAITILAVLWTSVFVPFTLWVKGKNWVVLILSFDISLLCHFFFQYNLTCLTFQFFLFVFHWTWKSLNLDWQ